MVDLKVGARGLEPTSGDSSKTIAKPSETAIGAPSFRSSVAAANRQALDGDLRQMLEQVRTHGENFLRSPDEKRLLAYKNAIGAFLTRVTQETFAVRQEIGDTKDGRQKVYQLVETVKADVDAMTKETLQKDRALALLGSLDDIRGLVLDLFT